MVVPSEAYTLHDHQTRELDTYALTKYQITLEWARPLLARNALVFNVGCGSGTFNRMAMKAGWRIAACEPDPLPYALALNDTGETCEVANCGLERFAESRRGADLLVMHDVLEHIADDSGAVEMIRMMLRHDAHAIISVPALPWLFGYHDEQLGHHRRYTRKTLRDVLSSAFDILRIRYFGLSGIPLVWYHSVLKRSDSLVNIAHGGAIKSLFNVVCSLERRMYPPIGTSILALVRAK